MEHQLNQEPEAEVEGVIGALFTPATPLSPTCKHTHLHTPCLLDSFPGMKIETVDPNVRSALPLAPLCPLPPLEESTLEKRAF